MKRATLLAMALTVFVVGEVARADLIFGEPTNMGPILNTASNEQAPSISSDGLTFFLASDRPGGSGGRDLYVTTRETMHNDWQEPVNLGALVNSGAQDRGLTLSADGLELYFHSNRSGGQGSDDLWVTTRESTEDDWGASVNLGPTVNSPGLDHNPHISTDGLTLFFGSNRPGGSGGLDIWVTTRATVNDPWSEAVNPGPLVNSSALDCGPSLSPDGLWLFFQSQRPGGSGGDDVWVSTRTSISDEWSQPVNLGSTINSSAHDYHPDISRDGSTLYFSSTRPGFGGQDLWQVSIMPIVDFNGDGVVGSADMCVMADHWGEDYSLCDIGPTPWGDGIVDVEDLRILADHLFEDVDDPTLVAHWPLDEAQGGIAHSSAVDSDAILVGNPVWQPEGGIVGGALQFDGLDDYVETDPVLNPAEGPFSVLAWVKGGAAGQIVVSQEGGVNWLMADPVDGAIRTDLKNPAGTGRGAAPAGPPLIGSAVVTDGDWQRIAFVWDGSYRYLYADGAEVAVDAAPLSGLEGAPGGLYLGVGSTLAPGTFFSGLIDDVRVYNRAVKP